VNVTAAFVVGMVVGAAITVAWAAVELAKLHDDGEP
jgi:hypothetical protein